MSEQTERKLEDLRDTISTVLPHEMRTPLNGILSLGEILATDSATLSAEEVAEMGRDIHKAGRRLQRLTGNFLIYAQLELIQSDPRKAGTLRKALTPSPAALIQARAAGEVEEMGRQGDLDLNCVDLPLPISEDHLGKIVSELTSNALKFSPPGSAVTIRLGSVAGKTVLSFEDRGRGFSAENLLRIGAYMQFDRRIHEQQGIGLGLVIAKMLAELHGGTLSIESKPWKGSKLSLFFPAAA
jgi:signal transduction histidine kinase